MPLDRFEEERVTNTNPELGSLRPDEATVDLRPFELGVLRGPGERTDQGPGATLWDLSGAALRGGGGRQARLFEGFGHACYGCRSHFREGYLILRSEADALGARTGGVGGGFTLRDGELPFEPRRLKALGAPVPRRFTQDLLRGASFAHPVELPFGEVSGVEVREGRLVLTGEVKNPPIG
jgi:hypothetical protein